jgi:hypothetical protein
MAARFRVETNDLTVQFFEKSFTVNGQCVYTGRRVGNEDGAAIAKTMQSLVNYGVRKASGKEPAGTWSSIVVSDEHLFSENESLKDEVEDLKEEVIRLNATVDWYEYDAISDENQREE